MVCNPAKFSSRGQFAYLLANFKSPSVAALNRTSQLCVPFSLWSQVMRLEKNNLVHKSRGQLNARCQTSFNSIPKDPFSKIEMWKIRIDNSWQHWKPKMRTTFGWKVKHFVSTKWLCNFPFRFLQNIFAI